MSTGTNTELRAKKKALARKIPGFGREKGKRREVRQYLEKNHL